MKTYTNLWQKFITYENFDLAVKNSQKGKSNRETVKRFNDNRSENISNLIEYVSSGNYQVSPYREKKIFEPKERMIYKLPYAPDRIIQHAVMNVLKPILIKKFILNTFACVEDRGQHKACDMAYKYTQKYDYCLKCDIRKFYPSINQSILSGMFHKMILDDRFMFLLDELIFSFPGETNCPIGNYTSQWFGNFYLTPLDNFVYHDLKCPAYVRYCDDFLLFSNDKKYLKCCKKRIETFLRVGLKLIFSKAEVFNVKQGVDFCGYRSFKGYKLVRKSTVLRIRRRLKRIDEKLSKRYVPYESLKRIQGQLASAKGVLKHADARNLEKSLRLDELEFKLWNVKENWMVGLYTPCVA